MIRKLLPIIAMLGLAAPAFAAGGHRPPPAPPVSGVVNLNTATLQQLELLPGVGPKRAKAILAYREKAHFAKPDDVRKVKGVGKGAFKKMEGHVSVSGPTTIAKVADAHPIAQK